MNRLVKNIAFHCPWLMSDRKYLEFMYSWVMHRPLDLDNPKTFNEKLQWLKLYDRNPAYTAMVDKAEAKKFAASVIGEEHIIPTIGVYDNVRDIPWDELPQQFVLKCTHDSGGLVICRDKDKFDRQAASRKLKGCQKRNFYRIAREWPYKNVPHRIICEKYMAGADSEGLVDYKFFCFDGKPEFTYVSRGLEDHSTANISFADLSFRQLPFCRSDFRPFPEGQIPVPDRLEEMKDIAERLSRAVGAPFERIDLYEIDGTVYFSEITFFPNGGYIPFSPEEWDLKLGDKIHLRKIAP